MNISKNFVPHIIVFILLCISAVLTPSFSYDSSGGSSILYLLAVILIYFGASFCVYKLLSIKKINNYAEPGKSTVHLFVHYFIPIMTVGVIYLIIFYPGTCMNDTIYMMLNGIGMANQHPWMYCYLFSFVTKIVIGLGGNYTIVIFLLALLQLFFCAGVFAVSLVWLRKRGLSGLLTHLICAVYCLFPIYNLYMITIVKDVPFSLIIFLWLPILYDCFASNGRILQNKMVIILAAFLVFFSIFLRNNGLYISVVILTGMMFAYGRKHYKRILLLFIALIMAVSLNFVVERHFYIHHLFKETIGIPLQQIAATVSDDGNLTGEEIDFINQIMPIEDMKKEYDPYDSDALKWRGTTVNDDFLDANKKEVLINWAKIGIKNPAIYIESYMKATYGFWSLDNNQYLNFAYYSLPDGFEDWYKDNGISVQDGLSAKMVDSGMFFSLREGPLFWLFMMLVTSMCLKKGVKSLAVALPVLAGWLTLMVSTPVAFQFRYTLYIMMSIPLLVGMLFIDLKENGD